MALRFLLLLSLWRFVVSQKSEWDAERVFLTDSISGQFGAYCSDGSKAGYYFRRGTDENKWKIHVSGGAWCFSAADCYTRQSGVFGSSNFWPLKLSEFIADTGETAKFYGIMDANDTSINPFGEWNFVWMCYCDGSSFTSNRDYSNPIVYNGHKIYLRGKAIFDAILYQLELTYSLLSASTEVLFQGTSAGGMSSTFLGSALKSAFVNPSNVRVTVLPDAGFFLDYVNYNTGVYILP